MWINQKISLDDATPAEWDVLEKAQHTTVNNPPHYNQAGIECIEAIKAQLSEEEFIGYLRGTIAKYNWRMRSKHDSPTIDAEKLQWFTNRLVQELRAK